MGKIFFLGKELFSSYPSCTEEEIIAYCSSKSFIGLDIETCRKYEKNRFDESTYSPGLDPYTTKICMIQIGDLERQFVIDARNINCEFLREILENNSILKIGHNLKFEGKHFFHNFKININNVWDTMIVERILYNGEIQPYSLEHLMKKYLSYENKAVDDLFTITEIDEDDEDEFDFQEKKYVDKAIRKQFIDIGSRPFNKEEIEYGAKDITAPIEIYLIQKKGRELRDELYFPEKAINLENRFTQILAKIELKGITVDTKGWYELYLVNKKIYLEKKHNLNEFIQTYFPKFYQFNLFGDKDVIIDWQSPKSVIKFAKHLKICPREKSKSTGKMEDTVGAKAMFKLLTNENKERFFKLEALPFQNEEDTQAFILNFLLFKKYQQLTTTFGEEWLRFVHPVTKKVYTNFVQLMNTGRMSSRSPNLQQVPSSKSYRSLFIAADNKSLVSTDYSAMECRMAADITGVLEMQQMFNEGHPIFGDDIHSLTATNMFRIIKSDPTFICDKKINKKERNIAKAMIFKLLFGGSDFTVSQDLGVEIEEGKKFYDAFFEGMPGMLENFEKAKKLAMQRGWIELDGDKRYFFPHFNKMKILSDKAWSYYPDDYKTYSKELKEKYKAELKIVHPELSLIWKEFMIYKGKLERAALNYRIQGKSATIMKKAMILLEENNNTLDGILLVIHDELVESFDTNIAEDRSKITLQKMKKAGKLYCTSVQMEAETAVGSYWIH